MKENKVVMSTLLTAQQDDSKCKIEGFCGSSYSSTPHISCGNVYNGGAQSTSEELDVLV